MSAAGVVDVTDDDATLTEAGAWVAAPALEGAGFGVVLPEQVRSTTADELLELLAARSDDLQALVSLWIAGRDPAVGAAEVVAELVRRPEPVRALLGFGVLEQLGTAATDVLTAQLDSVIGPQAWLFLAAGGVVDQADVPREAVVQAGVDLFPPRPSWARPLTSSNRSSGTCRGNTSPGSSRTLLAAISPVPASCSSSSAGTIP